MKIHPILQDFNPRDYGFKSGLEVHHQLLTEKKLFCRCPAGIYNDEYHAQVLRHMRPTLSELGEYDGTALMEFKTRKEIIYRMNKHSVCTYELDDNPPFLINRKAVDIAIEIALMLNCSIVGELHVARKQYLDGSIPAGFQRTAIVGVNGWIPYRDRKIGIIQLAIEEDSCREVSDIGHRRVYATDRLNMPLIEVVTAPDMLDPQEVFEVGTLIGHLLRTTGKVRRGLGSVRQDVNVSVEGGTRIEIKGVPRIPLFPRLVHFEAYRQQQLLGLRELLTQRGITSENLATERVNLTGKFLKIPQNEDSEQEQQVGAIVLKGLNGLLAHQISGSRTFSDDIAGRVRVIACLMQQPIILHTDEGTVTSLPDQDRVLVRNLTGMKPEDCAVLVWGQERDVTTALNEIEIRCREAAVGIPNETRQALSNGETDFERILPGADRMYPDTDSPPLELKDEDVEKIQALLPERPWDRRTRLTELGLSSHLVDCLIVSPMINLFNALTSDQKVPPVLAAYVLGELTTRYRRLATKEASLSEAALEQLFNLYHADRISRESFRPLLEEAARLGTNDWEDLLTSLKMSEAQNSNLEHAVREVVQSHLDQGPEDPDLRTQYLMGKIMEALGSKIPGHQVLQILETI